MLYHLDLGAWNSVFAVPVSLVEKHLKLCKENELKFILWFLCHAGEGLDADAVSAGTGIKAAYLEDCAEYWIQVGLIRKTENGLGPAVDTPTSQPGAQTPSAPIQTPAPAVVEKRMLRPDGIYIAKRMRETPGLAHVLQEAESILGKTLSPSLSAVLLNAHDDYNLPPEVIIMLLSYVKSTGKTATAYIESLARNWADSGVHNMAAAEQKIGELSERTLAWKKVLAATGIPHRTPSKKEEEEAHRWIYEMRLSQDLISEGYERCVDNTGKFSMKYMAKIFEGWNNLGLTTPEAVREHEQRFKAQRETTPSPTYDIGDFDRLNVFDILEK